MNTPSLDSALTQLINALFIIRSKKRKKEGEVCQWGVANLQHVSFFFLLLLLLVLLVLIPLLFLTLRSCDQGAFYPLGASPHSSLRPALFLVITFRPFLKPNPRSLVCNPVTLVT